MNWYWYFIIGYFLVSLSIIQTGLFAAVVVKPHCQDWWEEHIAGRDPWEKL